MCGGSIGKLFGMDTPDPVKVENPAPPPTAVSNGDNTTGNAQATQNAKKKRGFSSTRTASNTLVSEAGSGKKTLG